MNDFLLKYIKTLTGQLRGKRKLIRMAGWITTSILIWGCNQSSTQTQNIPNKTNIVFILSDDHALSAVSAYQNSMVKTPNIDWIAKNGITFNNAFVTSSLCSPSRASMLNGQYGAKSGFKKIGDIFDGDVPTLPNVLQKNGYNTALFGKWHLTSKPIGFNHFEIVKGQGKFFNPTFFSEEQFESDKGTSESGYFSDIITEKSIQWLEENTGNEPFALFIHHKSPHAPHITPASYDSLFVEDLPLPEEFDDDFWDNNTYLKDGEQPFSKLENANAYDVYNDTSNTESPAGVAKGTQEYKNWAYQTLYKGYYRQITNLDENIGKVIEELEKNDLLENTIIVYASDNGWFVGENGMFNKMWMYDASIKIPFVITHKNTIPENKKTEIFIKSIDIAPTLFDMVDISIPATMQGKSLKPEIMGTKIENKEQVFFYHYYEQFGVPEHIGVRTQKYKLIKFLGSAGTQHELYDLQSDHLELVNQFGNKEYDSQKEELEILLKEQQAFYEK